MTIIALLITISLAIALIFLGVFLWSVKSGQYEDTYTPSVRMLFDDKPVDAASTSSEKANPKALESKNALPLTMHSRAFRSTKRMQTDFIK